MPTVRAIIFLLMLLSCSLSAQIYDDYLGNGHTIGIKVSSSSDLSPDSSFHTVTGTNITPDLIGASRFLSNATLGYKYEEIEHVNQIGINAWIEEQMALPVGSYLDDYWDIYNYIQTISSDDVTRNQILGYAFYQRLVEEPDFLRERVAYALSQIFVINKGATGISVQGYGSADYYDILYQGAFGNYRNLLEEVSLHPIMGVYLSHYKNEKADTSLGIFPDENYAREIMQLFSIGLVELNLDGTVKRQNGEVIPTYDIVDIQELSKVFTGLAGGALDPNHPANNSGDEINFNRFPARVDLTVPMAMYEEQHEQGTKKMINGETIPAGQAGIQDIQDALDVLFEHDNTAPFIAKRLIQHLVKSNPSPAYVKRIALTFLDNGKGIKGDLGAVVKAILIDPEAIDCDWINDPFGGKLIQPLERFLNLFIAFDLKTPSGNYFFKDASTLSDNIEQGFLNSPTVFNFFTPFFSEADFVDPEELVSPEFQILNTATSINYINQLENAIKIVPFRNNTKVVGGGNLIRNDDDEPFLNFDDEIAVYDSDGISGLLDRLDLLLCRGQLSAQTKTIIENVITEYEDNVNNYSSQDAVEDAIYFVMSSPDYIIQK